MLLDLFRRPHTTIIDELESEEPMDFPALTICNLNSNRLSKLTVDDIYHIGFINGLISKNRTYSPFLQPNTGKMLSATLKKKIAQVVDGYQRKRIINKVIIMQLAGIFSISTIVNFHQQYSSYRIFIIRLLNNPYLETR